MSDQEAGPSACLHANQHHLMEARGSCDYRIADRTRHIIDPLTDQEARDERDTVAAAIAKAADGDSWVDEIREWEGSEQWERDAQPQKHPHAAYEDREWYRKQADAAIAALARKHPEPAITEAGIDAALGELGRRTLWKLEPTRGTMRATIEAALRAPVAEPTA